MTAQKPGGSRATSVQEAGGFTPPSPTAPGTWRCVLCRWPRWQPGTLHDALDHYLTTHQLKEEQHGAP